MMERTVIKAYKLINAKENLPIDNLVIINYIFKFFDKIGKTNWVDFDLNYGNKTFKSYNKICQFLGADDQGDEITLLIGMQKDEFVDGFLYGNALDNMREVKKKDRPELVYLSIFIVIDERVELGEATSFLSGVTNFAFDYGYCFYADNSIDIENEKSKKKFWQLQKRGPRLDTFWFSHLSSIKGGYLRNIYRVNFLNESHINNPLIYSQCKKYGVLSKINEECFLWTLEEREVDLIVKEMEKSPFLLGNLESKKIFENSQEKEMFRNMMRYPTL